MFIISICFESHLLGRLLLWSAPLLKLTNIRAVIRTGEREGHRSGGGNYILPITVCIHNYSDVHSWLSDCNGSRMLRRDEGCDRGASLVYLLPIAYPFRVGVMQMHYHCTQPFFPLILEICDFETWVFNTKFHPPSLQTFFFLCVLVFQAFMHLFWQEAGERQDVGGEGERERGGMTCSKGPPGGIKPGAAAGKTTVSVYWLPALLSKPYNTPFCPICRCKYLIGMMPLQ